MDSMRSYRYIRRGILPIFLSDVSWDSEGWLKKLQEVKDRVVGNEALDRLRRDIMTDLADGIEFEGDVASLNDDIGTTLKHLITQCLSRSVANE